MLYSVASALYLARHFKTHQCNDTAFATCSYRRMAPGGGQAHAHEQLDHRYRSGPHQSHQGLQNPCGRYHNTKVPPGALLTLHYPIPYSPLADCSASRNLTPATVKIAQTAQPGQRGTSRFAALLSQCKRFTSTMCTAEAYCSRGSLIHTTVLP